MTEREPLERLLRDALPPVAAPVSSRDLWALVLDRGRRPNPGVWMDAGIAATTAITLARFPDWIWPLTFHL
jgi:hypothetical protein